MKYLSYFIFILLIILSSCKPKQQEAKIAMSIPVIHDTAIVKKPTFNKIIQGSHSNILKKQNILITNKVDLVSLFDKLNATKSDSFKMPEIDFSKEQVVGLFMGSKKVEGSKIIIGKVEYKDDKTVISYYELKPTATTKALDEMLLSHPFYLATIKKTEKPVKFILNNC